MHWNHELLARPAALVLVDHGSRAPAANAVVECVAEAVRAAGGWEVVLAAHMEVAEPSLAAAVRAAIAAGARSVTVVPYFLAPGRHASKDVPRIVAEAVGAAAVQVRVAAPLGFDDALVGLVLRRAAEATPL